MLFDKKCPSNVIFIFNDMHNGNMKLEHFIDIDLNTRTYKKGSITLPIYKLSTGERVFLVAAIATFLGVDIYYGRVMEQIDSC